MSSDIMTPMSTRKMGTLWGLILAECRTCGVWWWYRKTGAGRLRRHCPKCSTVTFVDDASAKPIPCVECGVAFLALGAIGTTSGRRYQRYRCDTCTAAHRLPSESSCQRCGRPFLVSDRAQKYCSTDCRREANRAAPRRLVPCKVCGAMYRMKLIRRKPQLTCGKQRCATAYKKRWATPEDGRRARGHIRRARAKAAGWERIGRQAIIERDGLRCGICGKAIDPADRTWNKRLSLDHIVPISQGGGHTVSNLRLAHLGCNVRRGKVTHAQPVLL